MVEVFHRDFVEFDYNLFSIQKPKSTSRFVHSRTLKFLTIHAIKRIDHDVTVE